MSIKALLSRVGTSPHFPLNPVSAAIVCSPAAPLPWILANSQIKLTHSHYSHIINTQLPLLLEDQLRRRFQLQTPPDGSWARTEIGRVSKSPKCQPEGSLGDNSRNVTRHQMPETLIVITLIVKVKEGGLEHLEHPNTWYQGSSSHLSVGVEWRLLVQ